MNNPWVKILVFGLLFGIGGFLIGRCCGHGCGDRGGCHKEMSCCTDGKCVHGGTCCQEGGTCEKEGCDHAAMMGGCGHGGKGCCKGEGHGHGMHGHGDDAAHTIIQGLKASNFQGDTTILIEGGTVNVKRTGEEMEVKVMMSDSGKVDASTSLSTEKTVEVHEH